MAQSYDAVSFLLDRANIHDIVTKSYLYLDMNNWSGLVDEVFAPEISIDYSSWLDSPPYRISGSEQVETWKNQTARFDEKQHIITSLIIGLPQPTPVGGHVVDVPDKAKVIANFDVTLSRYRARGDRFVRNGGRGEFEVAKLKDIGTGNPWRVSGFKVDIGWFSGNWDVFQHDYKSEDKIEDSQ